MISLKGEFTNLVRPYISDVNLIEELWGEIANAHNSKRRYYHDLTHLENLFIELNAVRNQIEDWDTICFSILYHDIVYNVRKTDNEERSAKLAVKVLKRIGYPLEKIQRCKTQIIATKSHNELNDNDANLFTDADLSILGKDWDTYEEYIFNIRQEYKIYPDLIYKPGRKKIVKHFLEMKRIYKTEFFHERYEVQARQNLKKELG